MLLEQGAHYPWETAPSDGHDAAVAPTDWSEQHISLDVALGTIATARALNDSDFNRETAFPVVSNVAGASAANFVESLFILVERNITATPVCCSVAAEPRHLDL